ncbi:MAG: hypothetical protein RLN88_12350 [Ekhidna sp.]|uniref:hypothetical protein n=1 Tax=Ekhidna sp. TaxID=2608089 RepID=UPI0032EC89B9
MREIIILILTVVGGLAQAQSTYNLPQERFFLKGTVSLESLEKFTASDIMIKSDSVLFNSANVERGYPLSEINYLKLQRGTKAKNGFLIGAGSMFLISLLSVAQVQSDPNYELRPNVGAIILGLSAGGGLLGAAIGSGIPNYETYYVNLK